MCCVGMGCTSVGKVLAQHSGSPGSDPWTHKVEHGAAHLNPGTWVQEQGGSEVQGHLWLCIELEVQPRRQERLCLTMSTRCWKLSPRSARLQKMIVFPEHNLKKSLFHLLCPWTNSKGCAWLGFWEDHHISLSDHLPIAVTWGLTASGKTEGPEELSQVPGKRPGPGVDVCSPRAQGLTTCLSQLLSQSTFLNTPPQKPEH